MKLVPQGKDSLKYSMLYIAFELSNKKWKLGFGNGEKQRIKTIVAGNWSALTDEIFRAKKKLHCCTECQVISCYEAGRDGFWIHRALLKDGVKNYVIDSASIEVSRRKRKVKTDKVDVIAMLRLLMRYENGERQALNPIRVPSVEQEDNRRLHRERQRLLKERGAHSARIKSLLICHGIRLDKMSELSKILPTAKAAVVGYELPVDLKNELQREFERYQQVDRQVKELEALQKKRVNEKNPGAMSQIEQMMLLKGVGWQSSWILVTEFFSWREFKNGKQVGACAGLTPTPFDSGDSVREQGISKAGNKCVRKLMIELAWLWLRYQPNSKLSLWFETRFGSGGKRMRRIGIVALARKLLVSLWRYLEHAVIPEGAVIAETGQ
jgi:transposase